MFRIVWTQMVWIVQIVRGIVLIDGLESPDKWSDWSGLSGGPKGDSNETSSQSASSQGASQGSRLYLRVIPGVPKS